MKFKELSESEKREKGAYLAKLMVQIMGKPKDYVDEMSKKLLEGMRNNEDMHIVEEYISEPKEDENNLFIGFVEIESWFVNFKALLDFSMTYLPSHIEVIEPDKAIFTLNDANDFVSDLVQRLHTLDKAYHEVNLEKKSLNLALNRIIKNSILIVLNHRPMDTELLSRFVGIVPEQLEPFCQALEKEKRIVKKDNKWIIVPNANSVKNETIKTSQNKDGENNENKQNKDSENNENKQNEDGENNENEKEQNEDNENNQNEDNHNENNLNENNQNEQRNNKDGIESEDNKE